MNSVAVPGASRLEALFRTGHQALDEQHLQIVRTIRALMQSLEGPFAMETLGPRMNQIQALAFEHFRDEEDLMEISHYPHVAVHRAEHELIVERCHEVFARYAQLGSQSLVTMLEELTALFAQHIQRIDMDFVNYLETIHPAGSL